MAATETVGRSELLHLTPTECMRRGRECQEDLFQPVVLGASVRSRNRFERC